jgi:hypothetical protein
MVDAERFAHPDRDVVVLIDTLGRAVVGPEDSADTYRAFWTHTGIGLKQRGITYARADHAGKDATRGQRGSSGKGDDVDVIWSLRDGDSGGLILTRDAARMGWVPEKVALVRLADPLRFGVGLTPWPAGTKSLADELDALDVPVDTTVVRAREAIKAAGMTATQAVLSSAVKYRKGPDRCP